MYFSNPASHCHFVITFAGSITEGLATMRQWG